MNPHLLLVLRALDAGPARVVAIVARARGELDAAQVRAALYRGSRAGLVAYAGGVWRALPPPTCATCGTDLPTTAYGRPGRRARYCSDPCREVASEVSDAIGAIRRLPEGARAHAVAYARGRLGGA